MINRGAELPTRIINVFGVPLWIRKREREEERRRIRLGVI